MKTPGALKQRCLSLRADWQERTKKHIDWYDILLLEDELAQEGMESVVTNDPRTNYNLAIHLLTMMTVNDRVPTQDLLPEEVAATTQISAYVTRRWKEQERRYRSSGRRGWNRELFGWMLAVGWYSVFTMVTEDRILCEVWSPEESFPKYGPDGIVEHAHIYQLSPEAANRKARMMGWPVGPFKTRVTIYDYWGFDFDGDVVNGIVVSESLDEWAKPLVKEPTLTKIGRLPVFTNPVGGLPDMGSIGTSSSARNTNITQRWQKHFGEALVAVNEDLNRNYNRMRTFLQQAARYAAQPHWLEKSTGQNPIATEAAMSRWGSIFRGGPNDSLETLQPPTIPVELTSQLYTYQNELQRGGFPYSIFGNLQQQLSYLAMANIASAAMQVLTPFKEAFDGLRSDIDTFWIDMMLENGYRPHRFKPPKNLPERDMRMFEVESSIEIPGYLIQRATVARMLNQQFTLPETYVMQRLFPEISDPIQARGEVRAEDAMRHPKAILVDQILAYKEQARVARVSEPPNKEAAELYELLAESLKAELSQPAQPPAAQRGTNLGEQAIMNEAFPTREGNAGLEGMGRL